MVDSTARPAWIEGESFPPGATYREVTVKEGEDDLDRYPVARTYRQRLLGLSHRERSEAGPGLLIPRCSSVHTFGMRFELDLVFLDRAGRVVSVRRRVPRRRFVWCRGAAAVLEVPAGRGESFASPAT